MNEINAASSVGLTSEETLTDDDAAARVVSESDAQAFLQMLQGEGGGPSEAEMMARFEKNFQAMSYQYMKQIFSHVEDNVRRG